MAVNIDDTTRRKAIKLLEAEQIELDGAYEKQAVRGVSPGMESEFIPEFKDLSKGRVERRIDKDSKGRYTEKKVFVEQRFYDESVVDQKENQFKEDAEVLQEICRAYDNEMIRLNGLINEKKLEIVNLSNEAAGINCWPGLALSTGFDDMGNRATTIVSYRQTTSFNNEVEKMKIYPNMAGPQYNPGVDNPFDPDTIIHLTPEYAGFGYQNIRDSNNAFKINSSGQTESTGTGSTDGSGSSLGLAQLYLSQTQSDHAASPTGAPGLTNVSHTYPGAGGGGLPFTPSLGSYDGTAAQAESRCVEIAQRIEVLCSEIPPLREERDQYRNKLNIIKDNKKRKELAHWGYQNTKNESNIRRTSNKSAIDAIGRLTDGTLESSNPEPGFVLYFDAADNSSYFGSGNIWYDVSSDDYDDNGTIVGATYQQDTQFPNRSYFEFNGSSDYVSFDITDSLFGNPSTVTVEMLARLTIGETSVSEDGYLLFSWGNQQYSVWTGQKSANLAPALGYTTANGDLYGLSRQKVDNLSLSGLWTHYVFEMRSDSSYTNNKIYINGSKQSLEHLSNIGENLNSWTPIFTSGINSVTNNPYTFYKTSNTGGFDERVHSEESFDTAFVSASVSANTHRVMVGITTDPLASANYDDIDYGWFFDNDGTLKIYENGTAVVDPVTSLAANFGNRNSDTVVSIIYDGTKIKYYKDGIIQREINPTHGAYPLHFSSSSETFGATWNGNFWEYISDSGSENASNRTFNLGSGTISNDSVHMPMELSMFRVYNKALSQEEIDVNFNEVRDRFGI